MSDSIGMLWTMGVRYARRAPANVLRKIRGVLCPITALVLNGPKMKLDRDCKCGGEVWVERHPDGGWVVHEAISDVAMKRHHRFWIIAFLDWLTACI